MFHAAQTAKLLITKNDTDPASAVARLRTAPESRLIVEPSHGIPAYHAQVTK